MSRIPVRFFCTAATLALVIAPVATASPAGAVARASSRETLTMVHTRMLGKEIAQYSREHGLDGRSTRSVRGTAWTVTGYNAEWGANTVAETGLTDRNHDGLDDDARIKVRFFDNVPR